LLLSRMDFFHYHQLVIYHYIIPFFNLIVYTILFLFSTAFILVPYYISLCMGYKKTGDRLENVKLGFNLRMQSFLIIYVSIVFSMVISFIDIILVWSISFDIILLIFVVDYNMILLSFFVLVILFKHVMEKTTSKFIIKKREYKQQIELCQHVKFILLKKGFY
jgi:hypothetical protein